MERNPRNMAKISSFNNPTSQDQPTMVKTLLLILIVPFLSGCLDLVEPAGYDDTQDIVFYNNFAEEEGVIATDSGILYRILEQGDGNRPRNSSYIFTRYVGYSINREDQFDTGNNLEIFQPTSMQFFQGLGEILVLMSPGARYEIVLPSEQAAQNGRVYFLDMVMDSWLLEPGQFLTQNVQREEVSETESGLQYRIIEEGTGDTPTENSRVRINYKGSYTNDYIFDQANNSTFLLRDTVQGFREGVQLIGEGGTIEMWIPSEIGYGDNTPSTILPGAVLVFEVDLIELLD